MAQVRRPTRTWSPKLEVDGVPIAYDASLSHYRRGHADLVAEALEQPFLLPKDMEAYKNFNHPELFLIVLHSYFSISLHFIVKVKYLLFLFVFFFFKFLGHTASFCG